jgi:hypothetical protein
MNLPIYNGMKYEKLNPTTDQQVEEQNEIAEHILGIVAKRNGEPMDGTKSFAWQRGYGEAQERDDPRRRG